VLPPTEGTTSWPRPRKSPSPFAASLIREQQSQLDLFAGGVSHVIQESYVEPTGFSHSSAAGSSGMLRPDAAYEAAGRSGASWAKKDEELVRPSRRSSSAS